LQTLDRWLTEIPVPHRILDLGCGSGSLARQLAGLNVIGIDLNVRELAANRLSAAVCARSDELPLADASFDLVICHHSLEHFRDIADTIREIRRILKPGGRLFVSIPEGRSFSDVLYRLLLCGGDHFQRFAFAGLVDKVESGTGLHLRSSQELFTSFLFVDRRTFVPAPRGRFLGPLPRRMRWLGHLPSWVFTAARVFLNCSTRWVDSCFATKFSRYGWAFAFGPESVLPETEPSQRNVCMSCGAGLDYAQIQPIWRLVYRCPYCYNWNVFF
jgi:SAM-dependent methyltransferase